MAKSVIPLQLCQSSNIAAYGYQPADSIRLQCSILEIQFKSGAAYQYAGVPAKLFAEFKKAPSLGQFFQQHIRGKFDTTKVERDEPEKEDADAS